MESPNCVVVLPAGGTGERLGVDLPKQFVKINGKCIYIWTIRVFYNITYVKEIYLVISEEYVDQVRVELLEEGLVDRVRVVVGSYTRHRSIRAGVCAAFGRKEITNAKVVLINDVVRPIVSEALCERVAREALEFGACGPVRPLVSTIVTMTESGFMAEALPRSQLRASEMPQAFRLEMIHKAYERITEEELNHGTECLKLVQDYNDDCRVKLLDWHEDLFKVTYKRDLLALEGLLKSA